MNSLLGVIWWKSKLPKKQNEDSTLQTDDIIKNEELLSISKGELKEMSEKLQHTSVILHKTVAHFSTLLNVFSGLSKNISDFQEELKNNTNSQDPIAFLKKPFDFSADKFEKLVLEYHRLILVNDNMSCDMNEIIDIIESFIKNKEEIVDKIFKNYVP